MDNTTESTPYISEQQECQSYYKGARKYRVQVDIKEVINDIVTRAQAQIRHNAVLAKHLLGFSNDKTAQDITQINKIFFDFAGLYKPPAQQQTEPTPLYIDSLLPTSAELDAENTYKKQTTRMNTLEYSNVRPLIKLKEKSISVTSKQQTKKLNMTQESEEDPFTKEMRRASQDKKKQNDKNEKEKRQRIRLEKPKAKTGGDKISYDYDGQLVELKTQNKKNMVSALLSGDLDQKTGILKQALNDPHPTKLSGLSPKKAMLKKMEGQGEPAIKKKDNIQFSNVNTLADNYKTTTGTKYTYEGKTYEQKKRMVNTNDLKRTMSQRRLSKEEFQSIKRLNSHNREDFQDSLKKSTLKASKNMEDTVRSRAHSEFKGDQSIKSRRFADTRRLADTIHVSSSNLKAKMLEKIQTYDQPTKQPQTNREGQKIHIDAIDEFNMNYMKSGGSSNIITTIEHSSGKGSLPKIAHTTAYNHTKPKGREKIKDSNEIFREMRKRFEEKLRV